MINLPNGLMPFQENCVSYILQTAANPSSKQTIIVKSPTGSGKTVMLIDFIDKYLDNVNPNSCFIWFCPGKGDLEEQSQKKMKRFLPDRDTADISDVLLLGFETEQTVFINWEKVTKKDNKSITEGERKNLFERIAGARRNGMEFIVIIDEEHSNNTSKAKDIIDAFQAKNIIRVSATAKKSAQIEWYEVPEIDVINSGLITRAMYINDGVDTGRNYDLGSEYKVLLELAEEKRKKIADAYKKMNKEIRPLVIIQFPSKSEKLIKAIESTLTDIGMTYKNGMVAKWLAEDKINIIDIEMNNANPQYLLMKQAISTGWDCPRAKILIKLRDNMNEDFEIQTLGRLRRMPESVHYGDSLLDYCYLFTFDDKYKEAVMNEGNAFEVRRLFLQSKGKTFQLMKETRDLDFEMVGELETLEKIFNFLTKKYDLTDDRRENYKRMQNAGFVMGTLLKFRLVQGRFITSEELLRDYSKESVGITFSVDTHRNGIEMLHAVDLCKSVVGLPAQKMKTILRHLFFEKLSSKHKLLNLSNLEWYAFMINNGKKLRDDFQLLVNTRDESSQTNLPDPKKVVFKLPSEEIYRIDLTERDPIELLTNIYQNYDTSMIVQGFRSKSERLFEHYCERNEKVDWVYKNGDKGLKYFSLVYTDALSKQFLFYPDYIVKLKDGTVYVLETKGGETVKDGDVIDKNIDKTSERKFECFKEYAIKQKINWAFVRDKNDRLFFNNTEYSEDMSSTTWRGLQNLF